MKFALLNYEAPEDFALRRDPEKAGPYFGGWMAYAGEMQSVTTGGAPLEGADTATTVRMRDGEVIVQDGPFADTREQLGGFWIIDVPDLDAALEWAKKCPCITHGVVEIRPLMVVPM